MQPLDEKGPAGFYIRLWRKVLVDFLGRDIAELDALVAMWRDGLMAEDSAFYHEPPEYYVSPMVIPTTLAQSHQPNEWLRLCYAIYPVIGRYQREHGLSTECFPSMRQEIDQIIDKWIAIHRPDSIA